MITCVVKDGKLYNGFTDKVIEQPAVLIEPETDTLVKYGELSVLLEYQKGIVPVAKVFPTLIISLGELDLTQQAYVINRMLTYTQTGFVKEFAKQFVSSSFLSWLEEEMRRVQLISPSSVGGFYVGL